MTLNTPTWPCVNSSSFLAHLCSFSSSPAHSQCGTCPDYMYLMVICLNMIYFQPQVVYRCISHVAYKNFQYASSQVIFLFQFIYNFSVFDMIPKLASILETINKFENSTNCASKRAKLSFQKQKLAFLNRLGFRYIFLHSSPSTIT